MDRHREAFREEAGELLGELENSLLELEKEPDNRDVIGSVFRAMHTIKGSGAMFGFTQVAAFTHDVETIYDLIRNGKLRVSKELIDLTLAACDQIRGMIDNPEKDCSSDETVSSLVTAFRKMLLPTSESATGDAPKAQPATAAESAERTYRIRFQPALQILANGTNPLGLLNELKMLGECRVIAQTEALPVLDDLDPEMCYMHWDIILTTERGINAIKDVFIFVEDDCSLAIETISETGSVDPAGSVKRIGEILVDRGDISTEELIRYLEAQPRLGQMLVEGNAVTADKVAAALAEQDQLKEVHQKKASAEQAHSIRVPAEKLDSLVNMVGELVTVQSRLTQIANKQGHPALLQCADEVARLVAELRDTTMSIRMLPIGTTFSKFNRLVRDLASELKKEIVLVTDGGETELDKTVIERLNDPLVHLIRNSIDHGIERPEERLAQGKPAQGTIALSAAHSGASVVIQIKDDGAGLDTEAIRAKAIEKGLITPDAQMQESELFALILAPGFSTAEKITNISGRGVGMDVVRRNIDALQGSIAIASTKGVGTIITLRLPLTLAIIDGLLVKIAEDHFVMPLSAIKECVTLQRTERDRAMGKNLATIRGELVPYIPLRELLNIEGKPPDLEQIVTAEIDQRCVGFVVDQVIGQHQTVIKTLGRALKNIEEISGATVLGEGNVALILDLPKLLKKAERAPLSMRVH